MSDRLFKKISMSIDGNIINDMWYEFKIYQSIDSPTWSCDIDIIDGSNLLENLPILHGSKIKIIAETMDNCATDDTGEFEFYIYKIGNKNQNNQNAETYQLNGVSKPFLINNTIRINQRYENTKVTDAIMDLAMTSFSGMSVSVGTDSDNSNDLLINNWSPFISIGWLLKQAHKNNRADYMFFQNGNNSFMVDTIENMYSDSKNKIGEIITYKVENTGDINHYNIIKHTWDHVDVQQNLQNGYYKSTVVSYDFLNKNWEQSIYSHGDDSSADKSVAPQWKDALFDNSENAVISFIPKMPEIFANVTGYDDADKWVPSRRAVLQRLDSEKFSAQIRGSIGAYKWLGKHIYVDLPNNDEQSKEFYSRFRKGYYLVTAIVHHFTPSMYLMNLELVKMRVEK